MAQFNPVDYPHRRYNPVTEQWILVSPHCAKRPCQGAQEVRSAHPLPTYNPHCFLSPGNTRVTVQLSEFEQYPYHLDPLVARRIKEPVNVK